MKLNLITDIVEKHIRILMKSQHEDHGSCEMTVLVHFHRNSAH